MPERPEGDHHEIADIAGQTGRAGRMAQVAAAEFDLAKSVGGVRGVIESVVPFAVFSAVYAFTENLTQSIVWAVAPAVLLAVWRVVAREPLTQAISGLVGIAVGAVFAYVSGDPSTFFLPSIIKNAAFGALYLISILVRWPLIGVVLGPLLQEMYHWRQVPARHRAYVLATWFWVAMFAIRLAVQIPLFLADRVTLLGTLNAFVLGVPLWGLAIYGSWVVLRRVPVAKHPDLVEAGHDGRDGKDGKDDEVSPAGRA